jgi:hypothetical protein
MGADLAVSLQWRHAEALSDVRALEDVLGRYVLTIKLNGALSELGPFTEERIGELATKTAKLFSR